MREFGRISARPERHIGVTARQVEKSVSHDQNGWFFSAAGGDWEYPAFLILANGVLTLLATVWHQTCRRSDNPRG